MCTNKQNEISDVVQRNNLRISVFLSNRGQRSNPVLCFIRTSQKQKQVSPLINRCSWAAPAPSINASAAWPNGGRGVTEPPPSGNEVNPGRAGRSSVMVAQQKGSVCCLWVYISEPGPHVTKARRNFYILSFCQTGRRWADTTSKEVTTSCLVSVYDWFMNR